MRRLAEPARIIDRHSPAEAGTPAWSGENNNEIRGTKSIARPRCGGGLGVAKVSNGRRANCTGQGLPIRRDNLPPGA
jgi:hypothetical protein